jgi:hypothetical protein
MTVVTLDENELLSILRRCLEWNSADVLALGNQGSITRLGEIAGFIGMMDQEGVPRASAIRVVLPPAGARLSQVMRDDVRAGIRAAYFRFDDDEERLKPFVDRAFAALRIEQPLNFTLAELLPTLDELQTREVVVVGEAASYRAPGVNPAGPPPYLPEDVWSAHLHALMLEAEERARASGSYIILDSGQRLPARASNLKLLKSAGDVGLCGGAAADELTPEDVFAMIETLYAHADKGEIGKALALIDADETLSERRKWMLRLSALNRAGVKDEVSRLLDTSADIIGSLDDDATVGIAEIAANIDRDDLAQSMIERVLPSLTTAESLEYALRVARSTRRQRLIEETQTRLRALHPGSLVLRSFDARAAARRGDYAEGARLLAGASDDHERKVRTVYGLLAEGVGGEGFSDPVTLAASLAAKMPEWAEEIRREIMLSLERASRRDEAVEMILQADVVWTEEKFVFARRLIERSLVSGSKAFGEAQISHLAAEAARYIGAHPERGYARTSVADLLDADRAGLSGVAVLIRDAMAQTRAIPAVRPQPTTGQPELDNIRKVPIILRRVMRWLAKTSDGLVVAGQHTVPPEVLREEPDAVLGSITRIVDHHTPDANDPADEALIRHLITVALAVAPRAAEPDADIAVLRGAAIKLQVGGRPQAARDIAEQILQVAGDRPERRRRALASFADIYSRLGRTREALLALLAAWTLPSDRSWDEAWLEQSTLMRLMRDVGLLDESLWLINRLRQMSASLDNADFYTGRLDTLELGAQFRKFQIEADDAWSLKRLLEAATVNGARVLASGDEPLPSALTLMQLVVQHEADGSVAPEEADEVLRELVERLAPPHRTLVEAASQAAGAELVASIAGPLQPARYNDDVSYDLRLARGVGRRLARASVNAVDAREFLYAIELQSSQGVGVRTTGPEVKPSASLLAKVEEPLNAAVAIAASGLTVLGLAIDGEGLMMMAVTGDGPTPPVAVPKARFDIDELSKWAEKYPRAYRDELPSEDFRQTTARLGVDTLPDRAVIISGDMARLPPNILTINDDLAGLSHSLASTPSLSWLKASMDAARTGDGSIAAWVPIGADSHYTDALTLLGGDIEGVLADAGVALNTQSAVPDSLTTADLAIVGAHGGLAEENRYFLGLTDDRNEPADLRGFVDALRGTRAVVLFVCSGGRVDAHPESGALIGIPHRLLDAGVSAVVAPSWPVPFTMARPWLTAFLKGWEEGRPIIDACRVGNDAVAAATSHDLGRSLAMMVYGNPLVSR